MIRIATIDREFAATGPWGHVEFAIRTDGRMLAKEFLEALKTSSAFHGKGETVERKLRVFFQQMANAGKLRKSSQFSKELDEIYSFKYEAFNKLIRIPCFARGRCWVLTHGFYKPGAQAGRGTWRTSEINRAKQIMREHLNRFPL